MKFRRLKILLISTILLFSSVHAKTKDSEMSDLDQSIKYEQDNVGIENDESVYYNPYKDEVVEEGRGISKYGPKQKINMTKKQIAEFYKEVDDSKEKLKKSDEEKAAKEKKLEIAQYRFITLSVGAVTIVTVILVIFILGRYFKNKDIKEIKMQEEEYNKLLDSIVEDKSSNINTEFDYNAYINGSNNNFIDDGKYYKDNNQNYNEDNQEDLKEEDLEFDYQKYINGDN